jgi:hypothetical protein
VEARNAEWNKRVAPGASVMAGFYANKTGTHTPPARFTVNGKACTTG